MVVILAIVCLLGAVAFGWVTLKSLHTGETLDFTNRFADRSKEPDWYWAWTIINGATSIGLTCAIKKSEERSRVRRHFGYGRFPAFSSDLPPPESPRRRPL